METNKNESLIRTIGIISLGLIIAALLLNFMTGGSPGFSFQMHMGDGWNAGYNTGFGLDYLLTSIIVVAIKLLFFGLLIGFIFTIGFFVKRYMDVYTTSVPVNMTSVQPRCEKCGTGLHSDWKCCPVCSTEKK